MLEPLFVPKRAPGQPITLNIVVIPAIGLTRPGEWLDRSGHCWIQKLVEDVVPGANAWEYIYSPKQEGSIAQRLAGEGPNLIETLQNHPAQFREKRLPIVFICHGLGGFVYKSALCSMETEQFRYWPIVQLFSGVIFLGSPHFGENKSEAKLTFDLLLKCQNKGSGRSSSNDHDLEVLTDICDNFERCHLHLPVLSVYETQGTSTQQHKYAKILRNKKEVIVHEAVATLHFHLEKVMGSQSDHFSVCKIHLDSDIYKASRDFLTDVARNAPRKISKTGEYDTPSALKDGTLRSNSVMGDSNDKFDSAKATGPSTTGSYDMVPNETAMETTIKDPVLPCFSLGPYQRLKSFMGRKDILKKIDDHLLPGVDQTDRDDESTHSPPSQGSTESASEEEEKLRSFAICGLGGMGKTTLAVEYAYTRKNKFDAIFWLGADDANILASSFAQIAQKLGLEDDVSDLAASRDIAMAWLSRPLKKMSEPETPENTVDWLIIFDNVDNMDVLFDFWPKFGRGSVLVTSRDPFVKHNLYMDRGLNLPPLSTHETESLMQKLTWVRAERAQKEALSEIAQKLGGLPLAIDQMSGVFRRLRLSSYTEFLRSYEEEGIERLLTRQSASQNKLDVSQKVSSLATVWNLEQLSAGTKALLQVISLLDPDNIPEELLIDKSDVVHLLHYPKSTADYYGTRSELIQSSLIDQNVDQENISLHRLIQDTVKSTMNRTELIAALQAALELVVSSWPFQSMEEHHSVARFSKCEKIFPSVLRLKNALEGLLRTSPDIPLDIRAARLFNDTGWYMFERGLPEETKSFCDLGRFIGERLKDSLGEPAVEAVRESHGFLGIALVETNEHALSKHHKEEWLSMLHDRRTESNLPIEDYELGYAYNEIGVAYGNLDMLEEASEAFIKSITIFQGLANYKDTMLGWPEPNLGFIHWMQGNLDEAEKALVEILDIHAAEWGVDDTKSFKTGKILYGLGNVLEAQGRFEESLNFHNRCFDQFKKVLGTKHHRVGDICHKLAGHCIRLGKYTEAETLLNSALRIFSSRSYLINERSRSTFKKASLFRLMEKHSEANELLLEAHALRKQLKPDEDRTPDQLQEKDFDSLVAFWSR